jgi:Pyruvate/2-oxoacid:ferredoxin oxidoreductase delta subunit
MADVYGAFDIFSVVIDVALVKYMPFATYTPYGAISCNQGLYSHRVREYDVFRGCDLCAYSGCAGFVALVCSGPPIRAFRKQLKIIDSWKAVQVLCCA